MFTMLTYFQRVGYMSENKEAVGYQSNWSLPTAIENWVMGMATFYLCVDYTGAMRTLWYANKTLSGRKANGTLINIFFPYDILPRTNFGFMTLSILLDFKLTLGRLLVEPW